LKGLFSWLVVYFRRHLPAQLIHEAEDFAAETLAVTLAAIQKGSPKIENPDRYAAGVASHKCAEARRQLRRRKFVPLDQLVDATIAQLVEAATIEHKLMQEEMELSLMQALKSLPPMELRFLHLRYFTGLDNERASRRLGIAPAEGSRLKFVALARLRFLLRRVAPAGGMAPAGAARQA